MEEERKSLEDYTEEEKDRAMSMALQWLCSPRGGNNFYGRILNACGRAPRRDLWPPTAAVTLDTRGRYMLVWQPEWFVMQDGPFQLLVVVHEAAHLSLQHLEKFLRWRLKIHDPIKYKRLEPIMNVAADLAVNDVAVRPLLDMPRTTFPKYRDKFILPENAKYNYPKGQTFEYYFNRLMEDMENDGFDQNLPLIPIIGGRRDNQPNQSNQQGEPSDSEDGGAQRNRGSGTKEEGDEDGQRSSAGGSQGEGEEQGDSDSSEGESSDGGGADSDSAGGVSPADGLDDNYPTWFKELVNGQNPQNIPWDMQFEEMTSAEIERAVDRAKREAKRITRNAIDQTKKSRGTIPGQFMQAIKELLEEPTIPWQVVFENMLKSEVSSKLDESSAYPNPCFFHLEDEGMEPYPGYQKNFAFNISVMIDTSGSVSQSEFLDFMAEIRGIMDQEDEVTIRFIMFDAAIQYEKVLGPDDTEQYAKDRYSCVNRYGHGGTDFNPPLRYMCGQDEDSDWASNAEREEHPMDVHPDLAILLTDGGAPVGPPYGPIPKYLPPCPLIWVLTSSGVENDYMQPRVLKIRS